MSDSDVAFASCCEAALQLHMNAAMRHVELLETGSPFTSREIRDGFGNLRDLDPFNAAWIQRVDSCRAAFNNAVAAVAATDLIAKATSLNMAAAELGTVTEAAQKAKADLIVPKVAALTTTVAENFDPVKSAIDGLIDADIADVPSQLGGLFDALKALKDDLDSVG